MLYEVMPSNGRDVSEMYHRRPVGSKFAKNCFG